MTDALGYVKEVLEDAGYSVGPSKVGAKHLYFEDSSIAGAVFFAENVDELLSKWVEWQARFVRENEARLRLATIKSWNLYTIFVCVQSCSLEQSARIPEIEENFQSTRKIVGTGIESKVDVLRALLTILPLQHRLSLARADAKEFVVKRLRGIAPALGGLVEPSTPIQMMLDELENGV